MHFILIDKQRADNCKAYIDSLTYDGKTEVTIKPYKKNRSTSQNRLMWQYYNLLEKETGQPAEDIHEQMKVAVLGVDRRMVKGQLLVMPKSTTKLTTKEMTEFLQAIEVLTGSLNITLPRPDDYNYAMGYK